MGQAPSATRSSTVDGGYDPTTDARLSERSPTPPCAPLRPWRSLGARASVVRLREAQGQHLWRRGNEVAETRARARREPRLLGGGRLASLAGHRGFVATGSKAGRSIPAGLPRGRKARRDRRGPWKRLDDSVLTRTPSARAAPRPKRCPGSPPLLSAAGAHSHEGIAAPRLPRRPPPGPGPPPRIASTGPG